MVTRMGQGQLWLHGYCVFTSRGLVMCTYNDWLCVPIWFMGASYRDQANFLYTATIGLELVVRMQVNAGTSYECTHSVGESDGVMQLGLVVHICVAPRVDCEHKSQSVSRTELVAPQTPIDTGISAYNAHIYGQGTRCRSEHDHRVL